MYFLSRVALISRLSRIDEGELYSNNLFNSVFFFLKLIKAIVIIDAITIITITIK